MKLFIDLETLPTNVDWIKRDIRESASPPANYKKPEVIKKWREENFENNWLKTSFDGSAGRICCIGIAIDDGTPISYFGSVDSTESEKDIIENFFGYLLWYCENELHCGPAVAPIEWIGHNLTGFDLRFLYQRCAILNVDTQAVTIPVDERHGKGRVYDTLTAWKGFGAKAGGSMNRLCKVLGIPDKGDITGADVWPMYQDGKINEIAEYCKADVERTREIYKRLKL